MVKPAMTWNRRLGREAATLLNAFTDAAAKFRKFAIIAAMGMAAASLALAKRALAQACGPLDAGGSTTCPPALNPYAGGINYSTAITPMVMGSCASGSRATKAPPVRRS